MHYNFARIHRTLRITPAIADGLTNHVRNIEEIVGLLEMPRSNPPESSALAYDNRMFPRLVCRSVALLLLPALVPTSAPTQDRQPQPVKLLIGCHGSDRLTVIIQNVGNDDTAVIFGVVLGNGRKYLVSGLTLRATSPDGRIDQFEYWPADYPTSIGGRVDPWIVPLPVGTSYVMHASPPDFRSRIRSGVFQRLASWPKPARVSLALPLQAPKSTNSDMVGLKLWKVWRDAEALISGELVVPGDCH